MSGLVGRWPLHEWSGSQANDLSGNGNHGTINGATTGTFGVGGLTGYSFDGTDDYVKSSSEPINGQSEATVSCWVRFNSFSTNNMIWQVSGGGDDPAFLRTDPNDADRLQAGHQDSSSTFTTFTTETDLSVGEWYHVVYVFNGETLAVYLNNSIDGSASVSNDFNSSGNPFGFGGINSTTPIDGTIADGRVYHRALSSSEIQTLYEWGSGDYTTPSLTDGTDSGAVSRYEFSSGNVTADSWGSNTLTDNTSAGTTTDAIRGDAKSFDGTDDIMDLPDLGLNKSQSFTVSSWLNKDGDSQAETFGRYDGSDDIIELKAYDSTEGRTVVWRMGHANTDELSIEAGKLVEGAWYHLCGVYDSSGPSATLYINGTPVGSDSGSLSDFATNDGPSIGSRSDGGVNTDGDIDEVMIYDRALSSAEVAELYRWGTRGRDMRHRTVIQ